MKNIIKIFTIGTIFANISSISFAQEKPQPHLEGEEQGKYNCTDDAIRLCFFEIPNKIKITRCLIKKKEKLSPKCSPQFKDLTLDDYPLPNEHKKQNTTHNNTVAVKENKQSNSHKPKITYSQNKKHNDFGDDFFDAFDQDFTYLFDDHKTAHHHF